MEIRLTDLEPEWCMADNAEHPRGFYRKSETEITADKAQGILFLDPLEFTKNGGAVGTSSVLVWFSGRGVPDTYEPKARWAASGTGFADLSLHPSIDVTCGNKFPGRWHGWVQNGVVT